MYKSVKQTNLETRILKMLEGKPLQAAQMLFNDPELQTMQEYANIVAIRRLGYCRVIQCSLTTVMFYSLC